MHLIQGILKSVVIGRDTGHGVQMLGSGHIITNDGRVVTTRHVIGDDENGIVVIFDSAASIFDYQDTTNTQCQVSPARIVASDPFRDLAILKVEMRMGDAMLEISGFDGVMVRDEVSIIGYPHCVEGRRVLTFQRTEIGAKILLESGFTKSKYAVVNTQARPGQSGSAVVTKEGNKLLGILVGSFAPATGISLGGINPRELHQTTHCISAEYINGML
jgi:S1-C subfamily serine protease